MRVARRSRVLVSKVLPDLWLYLPVSKPFRPSLAAGERGEPASLHETFFMIPSSVRIVDVGPRDGLQNEKQPVATADKIELVQRLQAAGLREIEVTSFVSPKWVPQMADNAEVMAAIQRQPGVRYSVLVPNMLGLQAALAGGED